MKLLHVYSGNLYGGVERMLVTLARASRPDEMHFALCFPGRLENELRQAGATVHSLGRVQVRRPWSIWTARQRFERLLKSNRYDAVVCHSCWSQAIFGPIARRQGAYEAFFLHGATNGRHWLERWARQSPPDIALCNSRFTASCLGRLYDQVETRIVPCPFEPPTFPPSFDRQELRRDLGVNDSRQVIIQVARLDPIKGTHLLIESLAALRDRDDWSCWLAGGSQRPSERAYESSLRNRVEELGFSERIRFLGERTDISCLLAAADIYCQANIGPEGFGMTFVEAMHAGLPIVTTALGAAPEVIGSEAGLLVACDSKVIEDALRRLLDEPAVRRRLGNAGKAQASRYGAAHVVECLEQALRRPALRRVSA